MQVVLEALEDQLTVVFCLFVALTTLYVAPWAEQNIHLLKERAKEESDISGIRPGQFKEFSQGDRVDSICLFQYQHNHSMHSKMP